MLVSACAKRFQGALLIALLAEAFCVVHTRSNECQSTVIRLQQRVVELQRLLSKCESTFLLNPPRSPLFSWHSRLSTTARIGGGIKEHLGGLASRRLLQRPSGRAFRRPRRKGLIDVPADYVSGALGSILAMVHILQNCSSLILSMPLDSFGMQIGPFILLFSCQ